MQISDQTIFNVIVPRGMYEFKQKNGLDILIFILYSYLGWTGGSFYRLRRQTGIN
jgi:hypothetical protein